MPSKPKPSPLASVPFSELEKMFNDRLALINQTKQERDQKQRELADVEERLRHLMNGAVQPGHVKVSASAHKKTAVVHKPAAKTFKTPFKNAKSIREFAYEVLSANKRPMSVPEIAGAILNLGYKTHSDVGVFGQSLVSRIVRDDRFVRSGKGIYGLTEWSGSDEVQGIA